MGVTAAPSPSITVIIKRASCETGENRPQTNRINGTSLTCVTSHSRFCHESETCDCAFTANKMELCFSEV